MICAAFNYTCESISYIGENYLRFMLLTTWANLTESGCIDLAMSMANAWTISSTVIQEGSPSIVIPVDFMEYILDFVFPRVETEELGARYLAAMPEDDRQWNYAIDQLLQMMTQQLIVQISHEIASSFDFTKELELLSSIMGLERPNFVEEKDNFIWAIIINDATSKYGFSELCDVLCMGLYCRPFHLPTSIHLILDLDGYVARLPPCSHHFYSKAIASIRKISTSFDYSGEGISLNALAQVRDPYIAWIVSWRCPSDVQFQGLLHPEFGGWNDIIEDRFGNLIHIDHTVIESDARVAFLRSIILDRPSNIRITVREGLEWYKPSSSNQEKWRKLFASPILGLLLEQSATSGRFLILSLLTKITKFQWFHEEFSQANGLDWLPLIAQKALHPDDRFLGNDALTEILVDQTLFSISNQDAQSLLSSSYHYLQVIGQGLAQILKRSNHRQLSNLRIAFLWALHHSRMIYNSKEDIESSTPPTVNPPNLKRFDWPTVGEIRSFDFVKTMSEEEWQEWVTRLKVLIMGTSRGGLKPGPLQNKGRFLRDPDGRLWYIWISIDIFALYVMLRW